MASRQGSKAARERQFAADRETAEGILKYQGRESLVIQACNLTDSGDPAKWDAAEAYWSVVHPHNGG